MLKSAFFRRAIIKPELVAERIVNAVESGKRELFVPRWYRLFALVQALLPGLSARLVARSGYKRPKPLAVDDRAACAERIVPDPRDDLVGDRVGHAARGLRP